MGKTKSVKDIKRHEEKSYLEIREDLEKNMDPKDEQGKLVPPEPASYLTRKQKVIFRQLTKTNSDFSIKDSNSLSRLAIAVCEIARSNVLLDDTDPLSTEYRTLTKNVRDYDSMANYHEKMLHIPRAERFKAVAEMARLINEDRKLTAALGGQTPPKPDEKKTELIQVFNEEENSNE